MTLKGNRGCCKFLTITKEENSAHKSAPIFFNMALLRPNLINHVTCHHLAQTEELKDNVQRPKEKGYCKERWSGPRPHSCTDSNHFPRSSPLLWKLSMEKILLVTVSQAKKDEYTNYICLICSQGKSLRAERKWVRRDIERFHSRGSIRAKFLNQLINPSTTYEHLTIISYHVSGVKGSSNSSSAQTFLDVHKSLSSILCMKTFSSFHFLNSSSIY